METARTYDQPQKHYKRRTIQQRIITVVIVLTVLNTLVLPAITSIFRHQNAVEDNGRVASNLANSIASFIDGDALAQSWQQPEESAHWYALRDSLIQIHAGVPEAAFVYVIRQYAGTQFEYYMAVGYPGYYFFNYVEGPDTYTQETVQAYQTGRTVVTGVYDAGEWGTFISAWSPVFNSAGQVVAVVGVDIDVAVISDTVLFYVLAIGGAGLLMSILVGALLIVTLRRSLRMSLERIINIDPTFSDINALHSFCREDDGDTRDEIGVLYSHMSVIIGNFATLTQDLQDVAQAHMQGDSKAFINENKYSGGNLNLARGINDVLRAYVEGMNELSHIMDKYSHGDFSVAISSRYPGDWQEIIENANLLQSSLLHIRHEIDELTERGFVGDFVTQAVNFDTDRGEWSYLIRELNKLLDTVEHPLQGMLANAKELANGDFSPVAGDYQGEFKVLQDSINESNQHLQDYIGEISEVLGAIAKGDLTVQVKQDYVGDFAPIKVALNTILNNLNENMSAILQAANQVQQGSATLVNSAEMLGAGNVQQTTSVEELYTTLHEINAKTKANASRASDADKISQASSTNANVGNQEMKSMLSSMDDIKSSSESIANIIKVITDIAFQTNLLALNAAVEAARAGDHGKGFAVVAEEVRMLAGRSKHAAEETTQLIHDSIGHVDNGQTTVRSTADSIADMLTSVEQVTALISEIAVVSHEQAEALHNVVQGVDQISEVVSSNTAISEESMSIAEEFSAQTEVMLELVKKYKLR